MIRRPPRSTRTDTLFPYTTLFKAIDYAFVARDVGALVADLPVAKIGFDRWRMDRMQQALDAAGVVLPLEAFGQGYVSMSPALDALEADLLQERLRHGGHPALAMCAANAVEVHDQAGRWEGREAGWERGGPDG